MPRYTAVAEIKTYLEQLAGITTYDTILTTLIDRCEAEIDSYCGRKFDKDASATVKTLDGSGTARLVIPDLSTSPTLVRVRNSMQDAWRTVTAGDVLLEPNARRSEWPALWLKLSDSPTGSENVWPKGDRTCEITGVFGWPAVPDPVKQIAVELVTRAWRARGAGYTDNVGVDPLTSVTVAAGGIPAFGRRILDLYSVHSFT